jgi:hypothetical protein
VVEKPLRLSPLLPLLLLPSRDFFLFFLFQLQPLQPTPPPFSPPTSGHPPRQPAITTTPGGPPPLLRLRLPVPLFMHEQWMEYIYIYIQKSLKKICDF